MLAKFGKTMLLLFCLTIAVIAMEKALRLVAAPAVAKVAPSLGVFLGA